MTTPFSQPGYRPKVKARNIQIFKSPLYHSKIYNPRKPTRQRFSPPKDPTSPSIPKVPFRPCQVSDTDNLLPSNIPPPPEHISNLPHIQETNHHPHRNHDRAHEEARVIIPPPLPIQKTTQLSVTMPISPTAARPPYSTYPTDRVESISI